MSNIKVICHTNLDLFNEEWPAELPVRPVAGDKITSKTKHPQYHKDIHGNSKGGQPFTYHSLTLEVRSVRFLPDQTGNYRLEVELHTTGVWKDRSIRDFYKFYYAPMVNKRVSYFI